MQQNDYQSMGLAGRTVKNSLYSLAGFLWPMLLFFFSIPYFLHKLGTEQYGIWVLINSTVGMMSVLNLGIGDALIKFVSEYYAKKDLDTVNRIVGNSFFVYSVISGVVVLVGLFVLPHFVGFFNIKKIYSETAGFVLRIAIFGFVINLFTMNALAIFQALQRYDISNKVTMATNTVRILGMMGLLYLGFGLKGMVIAYVGSTIVGFIVILFFLKKVVPEVSLRPLFDIETMRKIFSFSFYSFLITISVIVRANVGNILVGRFLGASYVPYLSIPLSVSTLFLGAMGSLTTVLFPLFSSLKAGGEIDKIKKVFFDSSKLTTTLGFGIGTTMFVFSNNILSLWISPEFAAMTNLPFRILIISFMVNLTNATSYFMLNGLGYIKITAFYQNISSIIILITGLALTPFYGIVGMSISYAIANMLLSIYVGYAAKEIWERGWIKQIGNIYLPAIVSAFFVFILFAFIAVPNALMLRYLILYGMFCMIIFFVTNLLMDLSFFKNCIKIFWPLFVSNSKK